MDKQSLKMGFAPVYDENSKVLILGSFPSVKSREISFYYGNKQNRFWKTLCGCFNESVPETTDEKIKFLLERRIALWDTVSKCKVKGSADSSIEVLEVADLSLIFDKAKIEKVLLNGGLAYKLFEKYYREYCLDKGIKYKKLSSTSPANPRFSKVEWEKELNDLR